MQLIETLLAVLPYWHYKIDRPFKQRHKNAMSLETYYCLQMLRCSGPLTMTELAQRLRVKKAQATRTIEQLYKYGFVTRSAADGDRRCVRIEITQPALDYIEENFYTDQELARRLEQSLSDAERQALQKALETLLQVLPKLP